MTSHHAYTQHHPVGTRVPLVLDSPHSGSHYPDYVRTGANALSVDFQTSLPALRSRVPATLGLQGNLDPMLLATGGKVLDATVEEILRDTRDTPHIFNLGHGVLPQTDPAVLEAIVRLVHDEGKAGVR
mgnify:CR=1 FL=1